VTKRELKGAFAADAGVLIDLVYGTPQGLALREAMLDETVALLTHELAVTELRYILYRSLGKLEAWARVDKLLASGYLMVEDISGLTESAAGIKCERPLALPDCFTLALGKSLSLPALFAKRERELAAEIAKKPFEHEVCFLGEMSSRLRGE